MNIQYFCEDVDFQLDNPKTIFSWIKEVIQAHGFTLQEINYIFCSDEYLLDINKQHLDHNYYTDIITFDNSESQSTIESDIFISIDRVKDNAIKQTVELKIELSRVMIHGVLHLLGFQDGSVDEKKVMREKEDACLSLLKI